MKQPEVEVAIVGAGFAGMYLLHRLRGLGMSARVIEAGSGVGGTWYWNRYPGARCDIESMQYSYQFDDELAQEWEWSERYSPQPEILKYAEHVAKRYDLLGDIEFNTLVGSAHYDGGDGVWHLANDDGPIITARFCVMATGCLSVPNWPKIDGLSDFKGPTYHTAMWPHEAVDFTGLRVAMIGTGSSAIQSTPHIADQAEQLYVFQRTPNYSIPAHNASMDPAHAESVKANYPGIRASAKKNFPGIHGAFNTQSAMSVSAEEREAEYERRWAQGGLTFMGAFGDLMIEQAANDTLADFVRAKIRETVDDPDVAEALCPTNIIGGKRLCVDSGYYESFNRDNVSLVDVKSAPIEAVTENAVHAHGQAYEVDALVIATGFDAMTGALNHIDICGTGPEPLNALWRDGPSSYLGLSMAGFPNLFTVTGPGSPSVFTNMLPTIEQHVNWIVDCLAHMRTEGQTRIEASEQAQDVWWQHVQEVAGLGLKSSTESWYMGANVAGKARVFMPYYGGFPAYCEKCEEVVANGYEGFVLN